MEAVYDHFEITHQLPIIMTNTDGNYVFAGLSKKLAPLPKATRVAIAHRFKNITQLPEAVHQWPQFAGGNDNFLT